MLQENDKLNDIRQYCVRLLNRDVFSQVRFLDKDEREIVYNSYIDNIDAMIEYAGANKIPLYEYIRGIKPILLQSEHVKERY